MKKLKICLCVLLSVLLAGGILMPVLAEDETPAAAASTEITDLFSIDLFSNAEVNNFLCVFPAFCGELEKNLAAMLEQEVPFAQDMSSKRDRRLSVYPWTISQRPSVSGRRQQAQRQRI